MHLSAIFHFFEINDYDDLRRRQIKRFLPKGESDYFGKNRPYSIKEIDKYSTSVMCVTRLPC